MTTRTYQAPTGRRGLEPDRATDASASKSPSPAGTTPARTISNTAPPHKPSPTFAPLTSRPPPCPWPTSPLAPPARPLSTAMLSRCAPSCPNTPTGSSPTPPDRPSPPPSTTPTRLALTPLSSSPTNATAANSPQRTALPLPFSGVSATRPPLGSTPAPGQLPVAARTPSESHPVMLLVAQCSSHPSRTPRAVSTDVEQRLPNPAASLGASTPGGGARPRRAAWARRE